MERAVCGTATVSECAGAVLGLLLTFAWLAGEVAAQMAGPGYEKKASWAKTLASLRAKTALGETPIREDGSAFSIAPARTPLYFQVIDDKGHVIQTMRSWATLQPGENASCVGCHERKSGSPLAIRASEAARRRPRKLDPFYGPPRGFSFAKEIQPILDRHCTDCHNDRSGLAWLTGVPAGQLCDASLPARD